MREAANRVGVSTATIRRRIKDGSLRAYMTSGRFGTQWLVTPEDLEQVQFSPQDDDLEECEVDETEGPSDPDQAPPNPDQPHFSRDALGEREVVDEPGAPPAPDQPPPTPDQTVFILEETWEPGSTRPSYTIESSGESDLPAVPSLSMEQQAMHQAGYWKGRWDEARERILQLEERVRSLPPQLVEDLEDSRLAEETTRHELHQVREQLTALEVEKRKLELELERLRTQEPARPSSQGMSWWKRLFFREVGA